MAGAGEHQRALGELGGRVVIDDQRWQSRDDGLGPAAHVEHHEGFGTHAAQALLEGGRVGMLPLAREPGRGASPQCPQRPQSEHAGGQAIHIRVRGDEDMQVLLALQETTRFRQPLSGRGPLRIPCQSQQHDSKL